MKTTLFQRNCSFTFFIPPIQQKLQQNHSGHFSYQLPTSPPRCHIQMPRCRDQQSCNGRTVGPCFFSKQRRTCLIILRHERTTFSSFTKSRERLDKCGIERTSRREQEWRKEQRKPGRQKKTNRDSETKNKDGKKQTETQKGKTKTEKNKQRLRNEKQRQKKKRQQRMKKKNTKDKQETESRGERQKGREPTEN